MNLNLLLAHVSSLSCVNSEFTNNKLQANYTFPMATGGLALLLSPETQPHSFNGLEVIGKIVFILDLVIFSIITAIITYRFSRYPKTLKHSLTHPTESLFSATFLLACAGIIACIGRYGVPACGEWLVVVYRMLFWTYFAITFCTGVGHYVLLFTSPRLKIQDMTPGWGKGGSFVPAAINTN
jgi:tellurite resistance protein TehA-like permease